MAVNPNSLSVAIIGSGPTGLMAADVLSKSGISVFLFEKRKSLGRKLLIAGSSGLNITNSMNLKVFADQYTSSGSLPNLFWQNLLSTYSPSDWIAFIESLNIKTFKGSSRRYFVENMKAAQLLKKWADKLKDQGVQFQNGYVFKNFSRLNNNKIKVEFNEELRVSFDAVCFCLGGASYEDPVEVDAWVTVFKKKNLKFIDFTSSNVGFEVLWKKDFLEEAEGKPLKNVILSTSKGKLQGDLMITEYGLEGTPVYTLGEVGTAYLDLFPDLTLDQIKQKCEKLKENLSPIRRIKKQLKPSKVVSALIFHYFPKNDLNSTLKLLKQFPVSMLKARPVKEAISSKGGLSFSELDETFMFKKFPGIFAVGEMLDWDAPTGGFLIQGCVSQGFVAGKNIEKFLKGT